MPPDQHGAASSREDRFRLVRVFPLGAEPPDDLAGQTTPEERVELVELLTRRMWELSGRPWPTLSRQEMPVRVLRRG